MLKVNLGSGSDYREGYINVDFSDLNSEGESIKVDRKCNFLIEDLPFEDNSVDELVFSETLEHTNRHNGVLVLEKIYRVLKPNGILDLSVPNAERQMRILLARMKEKTTWDDFVRAHEKWTFWKWHDDLMGGTRVSDGMDGDSHKTLYSEHALKSIIEHVGFDIQEFVIDSSFYVKARK